MECTDINDVCERIIAILIRRINAGEITRDATNYSNVAQELGGDNIDCRSMGKYLGYISTYCASIGMPPISAIVKNQAHDLPGKRYFRIFIRIPRNPDELRNENNPRNTYDALRQYNAQLEIVFNTNWDELLRRLEEDLKNQEFCIANIEVDPDILNSWGL